MSGFFSSSNERLETLTDSPSGSSEEEDETSDSASEHAEKEENTKSTGMLSAMEAFQEVEGPPGFLNIEAADRRLKLEKKRERPSGGEASTDEKDKKKQRSVVISAEPVTYTALQMSEPLPLPVEKPEKKSTKAMDVSEFLTSGGGAMLPRKTRAQRDKEKAKREKGQSSHSKWKSEEEMVLRQQYD